MKRKEQPAAPTIKKDAAFIDLSTQQLNVVRIPDMEEQQRVWALEPGGTIFAMGHGHQLAPHHSLLAFVTSASNTH